MRVRDNLTLVKARAAVETRSESQQAGIRRFFDAAERRAQAADELGDDNHIPVALALVSQACACYAAAVLLSRDQAFDAGELDPAMFFGKLDELVAEGSLRPPPEGYQAAREILIKKPLAFDDLSAGDPSAARELVKPTVRWLGDLVEPRTMPELRRAGAVRVATAIGGVIGGVCLLVWLVVLAVRPPNVALHKPVTVSSLYVGSQAGATNGDIEDTYAVATNNESNPWVRVDLAETYRLVSVTVHQRRDPHLEQGFPMCIEISDNDKDWVEVGRRDNPSASDWTVAVRGRRAHFVRVRSIGAKLLALTEIEVRGRK